MKYQSISVLLALALFLSLSHAFPLTVSALTVIESMDGEPEMVPILDEYGDPLLGPDGEVLTEPALVQAKDEFGQPLYDETGNPILEPSYICLWEGGETDAFSMAEGSGCVTASTEGGALSLTYRPEVTVNLSVYAPDFVFDLWVYADVPERVESATMTVRDAQGGQTVWDLRGAMTNIGWNHITCPASEAIENQFNPRLLSSVTLSFTASGPNTFKADLLRVGSAPEFGLGSVEVKTDSPTYQMLERFDGGTARVLDGHYDPAGMVEGEACLSSVSGLGLGAVAVRFLSPIDLRDYAEDGYLYLWLWVEDAEKIDGGMLLLSSSEDPEKSASGFSLEALNLHSGWNELLLPLSQSTDGLLQDGERCDLEAVRCFAVYATRQEVGLRVDALQIGRRADFVGTPSIPDPGATETTPPETTPPDTTPLETDPLVTTPLPTETKPNGTGDEGSETVTPPGSDSTAGSGDGSGTDESGGNVGDGENEIPPQLIAVGVALVLLVLVVLLAAGMDRSNSKKKSGKKKKKSTSKKRR